MGESAGNSCRSSGGIRIGTDIENTISDLLAAALVDFEEPRLAEVASLNMRATVG